MPSTSSKLVTQLIIHLVVGTLIGLTFGAPSLFAILGLILWSARHIYWTDKIVRWSNEGFDQDPPDFPEVYGQIAYRFTRFQHAKKKREERLKSVIGRFQQSTSAMSDAIVIIDNNHDIEWWNQAGYDLLGLIKSDTGQPILNLFRSPDFVSYYRGDNHDKSISVQSPKRDRVIAYRLHHFGDGDRLLVARDITEFHKVEKMRRDFVANASHELRTPLTVIHGYLETLQDQELVPRLKKAIDTMHSQSSRMENLVNDLLTLSRLESSDSNTDRSSPIRVESLLQQLLAEARFLSATKEHLINLSLEPGVDILGDAKELQSAFSNIVFNAVRYTPEKGQIDISLLKQGDELIFSVSDTGEGIASHHLPRLTERFYRVDAGRSREDGGTGLGLAIVKHVLARHESKLRITSTPGQGSCFSCVFPPQRVQFKETSLN